MDGSLAGIWFTKEDQVAVQSEPLGRRRFGETGGEEDVILAGCGSRFSPPGARRASPLPEPACGMWDFHQVWKREA